MPNPNRKVFRKTYKKLATSSTEPFNALKKAAIVKLDLLSQGVNHGSKMTKRNNQSRIARGMNSRPVYKAGDANVRRAEKADWQKLNAEKEMAKQRTAHMNDAANKARR